MSARQGRSDADVARQDGERAGVQLSAQQRAVLALDRMSAKIASLEREKSEPIAIIGMACRFPGGASTPEAFFRLLVAGTDTVTEIPAGRFRLKASEAGGTDPAAMAVRWGSFLKEDVSLFDAAFFGISPREAEALDPQQRLLLEVTWEALEDAGQVPAELVGSRTGVYIGISMTDYTELSVALDPVAQDVYTATGNGHSFAAGRLSY